MINITKPLVDFNTFVKSARKNKDYVPTYAEFNKLRLVSSILSNVNDDEMIFVPQSSPYEYFANDSDEQKSCVAPWDINLSAKDMIGIEMCQCCPNILVTFKISYKGIEEFASFQSKYLQVFSKPLMIQEVA